MHYPESGALWPIHPPFARWIRRSAAVLLTLAAPAVSTSGALTTGLKGTSPAVMFPPGYGVTLVVTVAVTTLAAVLAALVARRDALVAIPVSLGLWLITGLSVVAVAIQLGHTGLAHWGVVLVLASVIGAAAGMPLARRGRPQSTRRQVTMREPGQTAPQQQEQTPTNTRQHLAAITERGR